MLLLPVIKEGKSSNVDNPSVLLKTTGALVNDKKRVSESIRQQADGSKLLFNSKLFGGEKADKIDYFMKNISRQKKEPTKLPSVLFDSNSDSLFQANKQTGIRKKRQTSGKISLSKSFVNRNFISKSYNKLLDLSTNTKLSGNISQQEAKNADTKIKSESFLSTPSPLQTLQSLKPNNPKNDEEDELMSLLKQFKLNTDVDADAIADYPNRPRFFSKLSVEGQSALLKTYEDTIVNELKFIFPTLTESMPRITTSKFRKILPIESHDKLSISNPPKKTVRIESFMKVSPFSLTANDPIFKEHQLTVSQQLEIAQQILDLLGKIKSARIRGSDTNESIECLKTYVAFANIWTKYFRLS
jgi:hypothetical protein